MIYFDSAATSLLKPDCVMEAVVDAMRRCGGSGRGAHPAALNAARVLSSGRAEVASLFHMKDPSRVCFAANATEALNAAVFGLFGPEDHIITTVAEHNSVLRPLYELRRRGATIDFIPVDEKGVLDYDVFASALKPNTKGVVCAHASNLSGNCNDISFLSSFCREHGLILVLDVAQTAGSIALDITSCGSCVICFTGHKSLLGPQGTGGLVVSSDLNPKAFKYGGTGVHSYLETQPDMLPEALEAGTQNAHGIAGLCAGIQYIKEQGMDAIHGRETALARRFYEGINDIPGIRFYGDYSARIRAPIVSFNILDHDSASISNDLSIRRDICTRPGAHCAPLLHRSFGTTDQGIVRFSFSHLNTEEEVDIAIQELHAWAKENPV